MKAGKKTGGFLNWPEGGAGCDVVHQKFLINDSTVLMASKCIGIIGFSTAMTMYRCRKSILYHVCLKFLNFLTDSWGCHPLHSYYFGVFLRFIRTFAEIITFGGASAHDSSPISDCWCSKSAIFILRNINYNTRCERSSQPR